MSSPTHNPVATATPASPTDGNPSSPKDLLVLDDPALDSVKSENGFIGNGSQKDANKDRDASRAERVDCGFQNSRIPPGTGCYGLQHAGRAVDVSVGAPPEV